MISILDVYEWWVEGDIHYITTKDGRKYASKDGIEWHIAFRPHPSTFHHGHNQGDAEINYKYNKGDWIKWETYNKGSVCTSVCVDEITQQGSFHCSASGKPVYETLEGFTVWEEDVKEVRRAEK